jgi:hypothetical protein
MYFEKITVSEQLGVTHIFRKFFRKWPFFAKAEGKMRKVPLQIDLVFKISTSYKDSFFLDLFSIPLWSF